MAHQVGGARYPVFDVMRIAAASMVVVSHSYPLAGAAEPTLVRLAAFPWTVGYMGVMVLFVTSGFLVSQSWQRDPHLRRYAFRRVFRIWPGLTAVLLLSTLVIGPLVTTLTTKAYFEDETTWYYLTRNFTMQPVNFLLPGVFRSNPLPAVNGSIWSLPYEVLCYAGLLVVGKLRLLRWWVLALGFAIGLYLYKHVIGGAWTAWTGEWRGFLAVLVVATVPLFVAGALIGQLERFVVGRHAFAAAAALVFALGVSRGAPYLLVPTFAFLVIYVGTLPLAWAGAASRFGDPSYGIYLYSFPLQQVLVSLHGGVVNPTQLVVESLVVSAAAGYGSWHLVERHGMRLGRLLIARTRPRIRTPAPAGTS